jgi:hypothetical protein
MSYPLLEQAPKDHLSQEFLQFLREKNVVIHENKNWLIIENCKYHKKEKPWYTAFYKKVLLPEKHELGELLLFAPYGFNVMIKPIEERSVDRWHAHIYKA